MEKQRKRSRSTIKKNRKRKTDESCTRYNGVHLQYASDFDALFSILVAALANFHKQPSLLPLINKSLAKLRRSHIQTPIISLLPTLLASKYTSIASCGADIVGSASLLSLEMNEEIASDSETVKALVSALGSPKRRVLIAACNAVLDVGTTCIGRKRLLHFCALEALILRLLQVPKCSTTSVPLCSAERKSICMKVGCNGDELSVLLLNGAINLINMCNIEQLEKIPGGLSQSFLASLRNLWEQVHMKFSQVGLFSNSCTKVEDLVESIFRLSIKNDCHLIRPLPCEMVQRYIFDSNGSNFNDFVLKQWELSPIFLRTLSNSSVEKGEIFSPFLQFLNATKPFPSFLSSILKKMVSCIPIASDELDILTFLKEVKDKLGCPIIYQQDIRVLRTNIGLQSEEHFFNVVSSSPCAEVDIFKCEEAFKEGYTIALRGMEFRFTTIAAIADELASMFGQPSVGANMYLTPPNSQGLACHYDDHCVFVCQLVGSKQWKVFSQSNKQLPRLYDPLEKADCPVAGCELFSLSEGDVLYIPRGFFHEACTETGSGTAGYSLHLTLGIEVEPPFEWEGFFHVALWNWNLKKRQPCSGSVYDVGVALLHAAIGLIGDSDTTFRKACLVAGISSSACSSDWLNLNLEIFYCLVDKIDTGSKFSEALSKVEDALKKNEDPFQRIRWLQILGDKTNEGLDCYMPFREIMNSFPLLAQDIYEIECVFMQIKSRFCSQIIFEDVKQSYKKLLEKYKKVRKQYKNGMISLHYGS
ncbi:hypothetical protein F8388_018387 [Cannabis sativa]|uniref:Bifunctional lysine-specific demethylase and histidyl-hydroxylase n=1 Tax=Cannabis sativa TaxID=3483 RepID=A0A7J6HEZ2_CANSA|nr:hypothetical protein F8388_018387 [Cannabis sativa]